MKQQQKTDVPTLFRFSRSRSVFQYNLKKIPLLIAAVFFIAGCVTTEAPNDEYSLASVAIEAARVVQSARYSPGQWSQAEEYYRQARILYNERQFQEAKELFIKARISAEKAENTARLIRQKNGDIL